MHAVRYFFAGVFFAVGSLFVELLVHHLTRQDQPDRHRASGRPSLDPA